VRSDGPDSAKVLRGKQVRFGSSQSSIRPCCGRDSQARTVRASARKSRSKARVRVSLITSRVVWNRLAATAASSSDSPARHYPPDGNFLAMASPIAFMVAEKSGWQTLNVRPLAPNWSTKAALRRPPVAPRPAAALSKVFVSAG